MLSYCWMYRKNTENKNPKIARTKNGRIIFLSNGAEWLKKSKSFEDLEAKWLWSSLGIKTLSSKIPLVGPFLF